MRPNRFTRTAAAWLLGALFAVLLAACTDDRPSSPEAATPTAVGWTEFAAQHPNILVADPEATNYAPPGWPLEPGDIVAATPEGREDGYGKEGVPSWKELAWDWGWTGEGWGMAPVWVVGDSGPSGVQPFAARFGVIESGTKTYYGHAPVVDVLGQTCPLMRAPARRYVFFRHCSILVKSSVWMDEMREQVPPPLRGFVNIADYHDVEMWKARHLLENQIGLAELARRDSEPFYGEDASW